MSVTNENNPKTYFDITIDGEDAGRIVFEVREAAERPIEATCGVVRRRYALLCLGFSTLSVDVFINTHHNS